MWSFIKICLICIIGKNRMKEIFHRKTQNIYFKILLAICSCSKNLSSFWLKLKQQWIIEEIPIFSNSSHLEWRAELSDTILKGTHSGAIPAISGLIWFSGFRGEELNVKAYDVRRTDGRTTSDRQKLTWPGELEIESTGETTIGHYKNWVYRGKNNNNDEDDMSIPY